MEQQKDLNKIQLSSHHKISTVHCCVCSVQYKRTFIVYAELLNSETKKPTSWKAADQLDRQDSPFIHHLCNFKIWLSNSVSGLYYLHVWLSPWLSECLAITIFPTVFPMFMSGCLVVSLAV